MTNNTTSSKPMNILLWIAQILLAAGLMWAGVTKLFTPPDELAARWPWTAQHPRLVKLTGILDLLAGFGMVLPPLLRIQPKLTLYAAYGIIVLMASASIFHISRGEASLIGVNIFFALIAVFILWGRSKKAPFKTKTV